MLIKKILRVNLTFFYQVEKKQKHTLSKSGNIIQLYNRI